MGKKNILVIIDMQNDFITGSLANPAAEAIVPKICREIESYRYDVIITTMDTHGDDYLSTQEGKKLPIPHCINFSWGHSICDDIYNSLQRVRAPRKVDVDDCMKSTFGSLNLVREIDGITVLNRIEAITLVGTCTDICVVTNALLLKTYFPEAKIQVIADLCAGTTKENHEAALTVMRQCQIDVI